MSNPVGAQRYGLGGGDAYYDAVKYGGYTGTREQFGRDQAEFAQNATAVAQAKEEVERNTQTVMNTAQTFTEETVPAAIQSVEEKGDTEEDRLELRTTELVEAVNTAGAVQIQAVRDEGTEQIGLVSGAGTAQVEAVEQAGSDQVDAVEAAGSTQVGNVNNAGTTQVGNVNSAGTTQVGNVNTAGSTQVQAVEDKGEEVLNSIPEDYSNLTEEVDNLKNTVDGGTKTFTKTYMSANRYSTNRIYNAEESNIGKNLSEIYNAATINAFAYMLDVTLSSEVSVPVGTSASSIYGMLAFDKDDICVWVWRNLSGHTAGDVVDFVLPENAVKMLCVFTNELNNLGTEYVVTLVRKNVPITLGETVKITDKLDIDSAVTMSFTGDDFVYGSQSNGVFDSSKHAIHIDYIPIDSGEKIVFTNTDTNVARMIVVFDESKTYSKLIGNRNSTGTSTWVCDTVGYVRLILATKDYSTIAESNFDTYAQKIVITSSRANAIYPLFIELQNVEDKVSTIYPKIQTYSETYDYDTKAETFDALYNASGDVDAFIFFTDPHLLSEGEKSAFYDRFINYTAVIGGFFKRLATTFVLCAGDWLEWNDTPNLALYKLSLMTGRMRELFGDHYYPVLGNHDSNEQGTEVSGVKTLSDSTLRNVMFPYQGSMYYSFKTAQSRFYVLNSGTDKNAAMSIGDRWTQIAWLATQLSENDDAHSAICMHILWQLTTSENISAFTDNVQELVGAYNNHSTVTLNSVTYDFTGCTGKVGFILGGHLHKDQSDTTNYSVPVIATINTRNNANFPSFDLVLVDWTANTMNMVRVGSGSNQTFTLA